MTIRITYTPNNNKEQKPIYHVLINKYMRVGLPITQHSLSHYAYEIKPIANTKGRMHWILTGDTGVSSVSILSHDSKKKISLPNKVLYGLLTKQIKSDAYILPWQSEANLVFYFHYDFHRHGNPIPTTPQEDKIIFATKTYPRARTQSKKRKKELDAIKLLKSTILLELYGIS